MVVTEASSIGTSIDMLQYNKTTHTLAVGIVHYLCPRRGGWRFFNLICGVYKTVTHFTPSNVSQQKCDPPPQKEYLHIYDPFLK